MSLNKDLERSKAISNSLSTTRVDNGTRYTQVVDTNDDGVICNQDRRRAYNRTMIEHGLLAAQKLSEKRSKAGQTARVAHVNRGYGRRIIPRTH